MTLAAEQNRNNATTVGIGVGIVVAWVGVAFTGRNRGQSPADFQGETP